MKTSILVILSLITGCVYSPRNTRYYNNDEVAPKSSQNISSPISSQINHPPYVQYERNTANEELSRPQPYYPRINPFYSTTPHPYNRTVYFVETR